MQKQQQEYETSRRRMMVEDHSRDHVVGPGPAPRTRPAMSAEMREALGVSSPSLHSQPSCRFGGSSVHAASRFEAMEKKLLGIELNKQPPPPKGYSIKASARDVRPPYGQEIEFDDQPSYGRMPLNSHPSSQSRQSLTRQSPTFYERERHTPGAYEERVYNYPPPYPYHQQQQHRAPPPPPPPPPPPKQPERIMIEIVPGVPARLRGSDETWRAIQMDFYIPTYCMCCDSTIYVIQDAGFVLCPLCRVVCAVDGSEDIGIAGGVGLGFTHEDLVQWLSTGGNGLGGQQGGFNSNHNAWEIQGKY